MSEFYNLFPEDRRHLLGTITGSSIISEMSQEEFHTMIIDCLTGENPRMKTENWAQSKVFHGVFTGLNTMFTEGKKRENDFIIKAPNKAANYLYKHRTAPRKSKHKLKPDDVILCQWICNLTTKGWDNILQGNPENLSDWANSVTKSVKGVSYGSLEQNIINIALYNASLSKKGGLKSAMGNLLESLLLFSGLTACGLKYATQSDFKSFAGPSFTLNVNEGRQADAQINTCIYSPNKIDIDIGFIGKGNPEIIADKTQRFGHSIGGENPLDNTIIIVSALPIEAQLVARQAERLGAKVITMSSNNWVYELSNYLIKIGLDDIANIPKDVKKARTHLSKSLMSSRDIISNIPKNIDIPKHWL